MNKKMIFVLLISLTWSLCFSQEAEVSYVEGEVSIRDSVGEDWDADPGFMLSSGDVVSTGEDGLCEIIDGSTNISLSPETVFQYLEYSEQESKVSGFQCVLGQVNLVLENMAAGEPGPRIGTASTVAGVRGTSLSVMAGADGSSLIVVQEGKVEVSAAGVMVEVNAEQGVEVKAGEAPGEVFKVLRGQMDFAGWIDEQDQSFMDNPLEALETSKVRLVDFSETISELMKNFNDLRADIQEGRTHLNTLQDEEKKNYYKDVVFPLEVKSSYTYMNVRYFSLSALSLRRYMIGQMYLKIKTAWLQGEYKEWMDFYNLYKETIKVFEDKIMPHLVIRDF